VRGGDRKWNLGGIRPGPWRDTPRSIFLAACHTGVCAIRACPRPRALLCVSIVTIVSTNESCLTSGTCIGELIAPRAIERPHTDSADATDASFRIYAKADHSCPTLHETGASPPRPSRENDIWMPTVRRNVCIRRSRPASARGFLVQAPPTEMSLRALSATRPIARSPCTTASRRAPTIWGRAIANSRHSSLSGRRWASPIRDDLGQDVLMYILTSLVGRRVHGTTVATTADQTLCPLLVKADAASPTHLLANR
jgi:hypothetical protein